VPFGYKIKDRKLAIKGEHQAILDRKTFDRVQDQL
jgi:hypothetical protein